MTTFICTFCSKICKNKNSFVNHERTCKLNPNRTLTWLVLNKDKLQPWNKGLSKEKDTRLAKQAKQISNTLKQKFENGFKTPAHTNEYWTPERRKQKSLWKKEQHKNNPELHPNRLLAKNKTKMTYPEQVAFNWLTNKKYVFEYQKPIVNFFVDFCVGNIVIEIDGERWHPIGNEKDKQRDITLNSLGFKVYRIRSKEKIEKRLEDIFK
jgi:very-short-patch-repair endonuclease